MIGRIMLKLSLYKFYSVLDLCTYYDLALYFSVAIYCCFCCAVHLNLHSTLVNSSCFFKRAI